MKDGKKQLSTSTCVCESIPPHRIEMLKQKISFYKLMFAQSLTLAVGVSAWYFHYVLGAESATQNQSSFLRMMFGEPEIVVPIVIILLIFLMMLALSSIFVCIGEMGEPYTKKTGYSMLVGTIVVPILILVLIWFNLFPPDIIGDDRLDFILSGLAVYVTFFVVFHLIDAIAQGLRKWTRRRGSE